MISQHEDGRKSDRVLPKSAYFVNFAASFIYKIIFFLGRRQTLPPNLCKVCQMQPDVHRGRRNVPNRYVRLTWHIKYTTKMDYQLVANAALRSCPSFLIQLFKHNFTPFSFSAHMVIRLPN